MAQQYKFASYRGNNAGNQSRYYTKVSDIPKRMNTMQSGTTPLAQRIASVEKLIRRYLEDKRWAEYLAQLARMNKYARIAETAVFVLQRTLTENETLFSPKSAYRKVCDLHQSVTELSGLYGGNVCFNGQYYSPGFPPDAMSQWVSEWQVVDPNTASNICVRVWEKIGTATAAPTILTPGTIVLYPYIAEEAFPDLVAQPVYPIPGARSLPATKNDPTTRPQPKPQNPAVSYWPSMPTPYQATPVRLVVVTMPPNGRPPVVTIPPTGAGPGAEPPHHARPPKARDKETKVKFSGAGGAAVAGLLFAAQAATEALDLIEALWDAIPGYRRNSAYRALPPGQKMNPYFKLKAVMAAAGNGEIDAGKAITNILGNAVEDAIYGGAARLGRQPGGRSGQPTRQGAEYGPGAVPGSGANGLSPSTQKVIDQILGS